MFTKNIEKGNLRKKQLTIFKKSIVKRDLF